jgi:hypothetical protein
MFSLAKLFGTEEKSYELLEASGKEVCQSAEALMRFLQDPSRLELVGGFAAHRHKAEQFKNEITEQLCKTFFTPLERKDIEAAAIALHKITKAIEAFGERFLLCPPACRAAGFTRQAALLEKAVNVVGLMVHELRSAKRPASWEKRNVELKRLEAEAGQLIVDLMQELEGGQPDPLAATLRRDLFELLETAIDRCRDAGNSTLRIALKSTAPLFAL